MALRFEELIERHHDEIFAYLWRLMGADGRRDAATDVEDLTQDVFLRAYEGFAALRPNSEIAQILSCSQESARANVYQAIRHMRLALEEDK